MTKMHMGNWTKMSVINGGTGNLTLGPSTGFPSAGETIGTNKRFHYVILATNLAPLEAGAGVMTDIVTLRRDEIKAKMVAGVYSEGDALTPVNIPVGALMFSAPTEEMLNDLVLEMALTDYGNVSGATGISLRNKAVKLNLTADATLSFNDLPPAEVKYELTIHATSANAGTAQLGKGFMLTLPSSCKLGKNSCPPIPLTHDTETVLTLTTTNGGSSYQVHWQNADVNINDLGDIAETASMALDIRYAQTRARFVSETQATFTISGVSPAALLGEPAHFSFVNDGSISKTIAFNTEAFTVIGSNINSVSVPIGYKADFTIRKNPNANDADPAYDVWINGINYNQSASGLATTFNPSDYSGTPPLTLSNSNRTIEMTTQTNAFRSARGFGGKNSGKWFFSIRCDAVPVGSSAGAGQFALGITNIAQSLNSRAGDTANSACLLTAVSTAPARWTEQNNAGLVTRAYVAPAINDIFTVLFDATTGKGWYLLNGAVLYGGNPEAGTGQDFTLTAGVTYYPILSLLENVAGNSAGIWTMLTEVYSENIGILFPSWLNRYWTA